MTSRRILNVCVAGLGLCLAGGLNSWAVTLGQGVDNTNLVWTTGGNAAWFATNAPFITTFDGADAAASGVIAANQESWIQTTVSGPGTLSFWWYVSSEDLDFLEFQIDGVLQDSISGEFVPLWEYRSYAITNGSHTLKWRYIKDDDINGGEDQGYLDQVKFTTGPTLPLAGALNTPYWGWNAGGNSNPTYWAGQTNVFRTDGQAAESGATTHGQESWMEVMVVGVTNVSFWWKVSSETNFDFLKFSVDGTNKFSISGEVGWQLKTNVVLTPGVHKLRWAYTNDDTTIMGLNRGWVDEVTFRPSLPPGPMTLSTPVPLPDGQVQFALNYELGRSCQIQYSTNLATANWTTLVSTNTSAATTVIVDAGASNSPARFYRALAP